MKEKDIQNIMGPILLKKQNMVFPNTKAIHKRFESDLVRVNSDGRVWEYEIKTSYSDFKADFKKVRKHISLKAGETGVNYFYYLCPYGVIPLCDVAAPYGLIYIKGFDLHCVKRAKLLHSRSIDIKTKDRLTRSLGFKVFKS
tara:strand:+ start:20144 stop:20569 length:426 start_codon:yes stop_codon:yes gene_type:complete